VRIFYTCKLVTSALSWVVCTRQNSRRAKRLQPAIGRRPSSPCLTHALPRILAAGASRENAAQFATFAISSSSIQHLDSSLQNLIANPELEFHVTPIRISELKFSNRKFFAVFRVAFQSYAAAPLPLSTASPSSIQRLASSFQNLIETPRLEFRATPTKQSLTPNSNRDKRGVLSSAFRRHLRVESSNKPLDDSVALWPTCGATLTLREPQSNVAASCFVRAFADEHS
jgi:hypothetical protein